jgi:hypothetical protein
MIQNGSFPCPRNSLRKEPFRVALIAARLSQDVHHVAALIHGTPEILLAVDSNEGLFQMQNIAEAALAPLQFSSIVKTNF